MLGAVFLVIAFSVLIGMCIFCMRAWDEAERWHQEEFSFYKKCFQKEVEE